MSRGIKVFAPATVANLGCGFDVLGLALDSPGDEVVARINDSHKGLRITSITGAKGKLPFDPKKNTASVAAQALLDYIGDNKTGIDIEIRKKMPIGSGLGSSAASAVAGVYAVNEILRRPIKEKRHLLPFAAAGEAIASGSIHLDNVAPSLLGGTQLIRDNRSFDTHRLPFIPGMKIVVVYPQVEILTKDARNLLSSTVEINSFTQQSANLASFVAGFYRSDLDLISRSMTDIIIEKQRSHLIPKFNEIQSKALELGALGSSISGAGPSIFALCANSIIADNIEEEIAKIYTAAKIKHIIYNSNINTEGAIKF